MRLIIDGSGAGVSERELRWGRLLRGMRSRTTLLTAAMALTLATGPPAAGDTLVHGDPSAENLTAHGGVLMWSRRDAQGKHHLVQRVGTVVSDAPVASSGHAFDPDLGPAGKGRVVAVYERCRKGFRRCDLYRLDVTSGRERRIRAVSTRGASEFGASVWGERYAFARQGPSREGLFTAARGAHEVPGPVRGDPDRRAEPDHRAWPPTPPGSACRWTSAGYTCTACGRAAAGDRVWSTVATRAPRRAPL